MSLFLFVLSVFFLESGRARIFPRVSTCDGDLNYNGYYTKDESAHDRRARKMARENQEQV